LKLSHSPFSNFIFFPSICHWCHYSAFNDTAKEKFLTGIDRVAAEEYVCMKGDFIAQLRGYREGYENVVGTNIEGGTDTRGGNILDICMYRKFKRPSCPLPCTVYINDTPQTHSVHLALFANDICT
jgi:hypothetical protein